VLGPQELEGKAWPDGALVNRRKELWRVVGRIEAEDPEVFAVLVVEPVLQS
jgi:hypothetical protein